MSTLQERFEAKYVAGAVDECWEWTACLHSYGYGQIAGPRNKTLYAHRFSWEIYRGPIPEGMCVCHHCDNPSCVNPNHLFVGTNADNMRDRDAKGRIVRSIGKDNGNATILDSEVPEIRMAYAAGGVSQRQLAAQYGVTHPCIGEIVRGEGRFRL